MSWTDDKKTAWTWYRGAWHKGNPMLMGPMTHAPWLGSCVFDGARAFDHGLLDLQQHQDGLLDVVFADVDDHEHATVGEEEVRVERFADVVAEAGAVQRHAVGQRVVGGLQRLGLLDQ